MVGGVCTSLDHTSVHAVVPRAFGANVYSAR